MARARMRKLRLTRHVTVCDVATSWSAAIQRRPRDRAYEKASCIRCFGVKQSAHTTQSS
jgi:hypothetical protein